MNLEKAIKKYDIRITNIHSGEICYVLGNRSIYDLEPNTGTWTAYGKDLFFDSESDAVDWLTKKAHPIKHKKWKTLAVETAIADMLPDTDNYRRIKVGQRMVITFDGEKFTSKIQERTRNNDQP